MANQRTGLLAKKLGMTRIFQDDGTHVPVTVLQLDGLQVVAQRTVERDGYSAVTTRLGQGQGKERLATELRPLRQGEGRAETEAGRVPCRRRCAAGAGCHAIGGALRGRAEDRRVRHDAGQGLRRRHEALEIFPDSRRATAFPSAIAAWVPPATGRIPARPSRTRRWPATSVSSALPR